MASISSRWTKLVSSSRLRRSSHLLSADASNIWIFGGELLPRQPVDNEVDLIKAVAESKGTASSPRTYHSNS
jgi:hypothetical protein